MQRFKSTKLVTGIFVLFGLGACMSQDVSHNEQQARMQRCEQYIDRAKEECMQGIPVTIEDYNQDYQEYQRKQEQENKTIKLIYKKPEEDKPVDEPEA